MADSEHGPDAVDDELNSQCAEHHTEQPIRHVRAGDTEQPHERRRQPHREQRQRQHRDDGDEEPEEQQRLLPDTHRTEPQQDRGERARPEMNGNASGNTEMSARRTLSARSLLEVRVPDSRAKTISSAMRNSSMPPKIRNASMLIRQRSGTSRHRVRTAG